MSKESGKGDLDSRVETQGLTGHQYLLEENEPTPMDSLIEELRKSRRGELDPNSKYDQAYLAFKERCFQLWDQGILPRENEGHLWSEEHDEIVNNLLEQVWQEFNLGNYALRHSD
jgi:hypothetical protein